MHARKVSSCLGPLCECSFWLMSHISYGSYYVNFGILIWFPKFLLCFYHIFFMFCMVF